MRQALRQVLEREDEVEVIDYCPSLDALGIVLERVPQTWLLPHSDATTHTDEGIRFAEELRDTHPAIGVVVVSQYSHAEYALRLLQRGSAGRAYLIKEHIGHRNELMTAIRTVA